ncbi:unnamed protein product, partial [Ascophyllum nodosum]
QKRRARAVVRPEAGERYTRGRRGNNIHSRGVPGCRLGRGCPGYPLSYDFPRCAGKGGADRKRRIRGGVRRYPRRDAESDNGLERRSGCSLSGRDELDGGAGMAVTF